MAWCLQNTSGLAPLLQGAMWAPQGPCVSMDSPVPDIPTQIMSSQALSCALQLYPDYHSLPAHPSMR